MQHVHDMPFGAALAERGVHFRLWAPGAREVRLVLQPGRDEERAIEARRDDDGWCRVVVDEAGPGTLYLWEIDARQRVPDPASRFNPLGPHGPSQVVDPRKFEWSTGWKGRPWHETVIYEMHVGTFTPAGTYAAAEAQLPALAESGVTAIELMPLAAFPGRFGWGYDGVLPYAPHAAYGSPQDLKRFVQACHRQGLMVFLDVVYNHFGPDGNYLHAYAPQFFNPRHQTAWGPAVNFDAEGSDVVRQFFIHNALYWLEEYRFDGLRFDAVHAMKDDGSPDIMEAISQAVRECCGDRHVHLMLENDSNDVDRLAAPATPGRFEGQWNGDFHHTLHVVLTGERDGYYAEYDRPMDQLARCLVAGFAREGEPHVVEGAAPRRDATRPVTPLCTVNFLQNHDQIGNRAFGERLRQLADDASLQLASAILLLSPGIPMLFMGEEFGATTPFLYFADWSGDLREAVREGRRREFSHFPRYAEAAVRGELPDPCSEETFQRCKLDWGSASAVAHREWRRLHAELLAARHRHLVPRLPHLRSEGHEARRMGASGLQVRWHFDDGSVVEMLANLGPQPLPGDALGEAPALEETQLIYSVGGGAAGGLGPWAGRWHLGRQPQRRGLARGAH
ncbi:MAG TPA: malto-oligosyltrehalose trehalohydrolase [Burkholderiaceae bacterium]|nr:malto-oligosyltrehalose trehalohydrolase [Burkholderiaceae bacterium]